MSNGEKKLVPQLRFREFKSTEEWHIKRLKDISTPISEKAGSKSYTLLSITAGIGLVSQVEKFGREIAGAAYKNYYVIKKGDFAYNKSSTKQHPEGQIALLETHESGAVPNSIFTCFRLSEDNVLPNFLKYPFANNIHGKWLRNFIQVGARANGALNVDNKELFALPIALPSLLEQQKIADFLSSIDDIISAQSQKINALKDHKTGLMQQLFPAEGEALPRLRFSDFKQLGDWEEKSLKDICQMQAGKFVSASDIQERDNNLFPCYGGNGLRGFTKSYTHTGKFSIIGRQGALCGNV
jgi:type I restriction enzyme S subunit